MHTIHPKGLLNWDGVRVAIYSIMSTVPPPKLQRNYASKLIYFKGTIRTSFLYFFVVDLSSYFYTSWYINNDHFEEYLCLFLLLLSLLLLSISLLQEIFFLSMREERVRQSYPTLRGQEGSFLSAKKKTKYC